MPADIADLLDEAANRYAADFDGDPKYALLSRSDYGKVVLELTDHRALPTASLGPTEFQSCVGMLAIILVPGDAPPAVAGSPVFDFMHNTQTKQE